MATPGRLVNFVERARVSLACTQFLLLDEADRMLDMGFEQQIRVVMNNLPTKHQTLLFSATMPADVESLANDYLSDPVKVKVGAAGASKP